MAQESSTGQKARSNAFCTSIMGSPTVLQASWGAQHARISHVDTFVILPFITTVTIRLISGYYGAVWYRFQDKLCLCLIVLKKYARIADATVRRIVLVSTPHSSAFKSYNKHKIGENMYKKYGIWMPVLWTYSMGYSHSKVGNFGLKIWEHEHMMHSEAWVCSVFCFSLRWALYWYFDYFLSKISAENVEHLPGHSNTHRTLIEKIGDKSSPPVDRNRLPLKVSRIKATILEGGGRIT